MRLPLPALIAGAVALVTAVVQLRHGIIPLLDTVTYWSGTRSTAAGHPFTTELAPSFTNFTAVEFVERGGRLPFVDFPVGYPTVAGIVATLTGPSGALAVLVITASTLAAVLIATGPSPTDAFGAFVRVVAATGLVLLPVSRLVVQGALSEPLFIALAVGFLLALLRYREGRGGFVPVVLIGASLGLIRFIGAPLAVLAGVEHFRRHRKIGPAVGWTAVMGAPAACNVVAAAAAGGGHSPGWRGLDESTLELFVRSVGGWVDARQGDLRITYFGGEGAAAWSWVLTAAWTLAVLTAFAAVTASLFRRPGRLLEALERIPATLTLPLAAAGIVSAGLVAGMLGFDALVVPDNRLMFPTGVLTAVGIVWTITDRRQHLRTLPASFVVVLVLGAWFVGAVRPWLLLERFSDEVGTPPYVEVLRDRSPNLVVTNSADGIHWETGIPAAYLPLPVRALTGEVVDQDAELRALPCPLSSAGGVIVVVDDALFGSTGDETLRELVSEGRLEAVAIPGGTLYEPLPAACN